MSGKIRNIEKVRPHISLGGAIIYQNFLYTFFIVNFVA